MLPVYQNQQIEVLLKSFAFALQHRLGGDVGKDIYNLGLKLQDVKDRIRFYTSAIKSFDNTVTSGEADLSPLEDLELYVRAPVDVETFICDKEYLNREAEIYPKVLDAIIELNSGKYVEAVLTGGIGSAKTTIAIYTTAYQLYLLSCYRNPHRLFGLDPSSEIEFICQSINKTLAKSVDYARLKALLEQSEYFQDCFRYNPNIMSELVFPNRIKVIPVAGLETATIGQNVIGGIIDELNYMSVIEKSKLSVDKGTYDQAVALYNSIARRRKTRFMQQGMLPGILCLVSSKKYPGQFTDSKVAEAKDDPTIFVYDRRVWEIKPEGTYSGEVFKVFIGDISRKPRILEEKEEVTEERLVIDIPVEHREDFRKDIINALREIAGVSTLARHPFLINVDVVSSCFGKTDSIFEQDKVDFVETQLHILKDRIKNPQYPRFAHIDLGLTSDNAGIAIGYVDKFVTVNRDEERSEVLPSIVIDGVLAVAPPTNGEILFYKIRRVLYLLKDLGVNIRWITFDSFQSVDSQQLLMAKGFLTGMQSIDKSEEPYGFLKAALYDKRISCPIHNITLKELVSLERDTKTGKIDHPPGGSKDCSDALAGVVYGLTLRREVWAMFNIPTVMIPDSVKNAKEVVREKKDTGDIQEVVYG